MLKGSLYDTVLFYLYNNKQDFINSLVSLIPSFAFTLYFQDIEKYDNEQLARLITGFLAGDNRLQAAKKIKVKYNVLADNYTTDSDIFSEIKKLNNDYSDITIDEARSNLQKKSSSSGSEWWTEAGDFFGDMIGGHKEPSTSSTTHTETGINPFIIVGVIAGLIAAVVVISKMKMK